MVEVLYISYDGMTDPLGQSQVIPYLLKLTGYGYHFHILSFEKEKNFLAEKDSVARLLKQHNIEWYPLPYTLTPPVLSTVSDLKKMKFKSRALTEKYNIQLVHCRSYIPGLVGLHLKKKYGVRFLFDMRGFWADERVDGGLWNLKKPLYWLIYRYFKSKERKMLKSADAVISLTHAAKKEIANWKLKPSGEVPVTVIPCCADLDLFNPGIQDPEQLKILKSELILEDHHPVLSYLGTIGTWYMLEEMMEFFRQLLFTYPTAVLLFITKENPEHIMQIALEKDIPPELIRITSASREKVPLYLSLSDVSLFFIKPAWSKKASSPTKQGEIMAMGIPLICNTGVGDTDAIVEKYHSGILIEAGNQQSYRKAIKDLENLKDFKKADIRTGANDYFSLEKGVQKYLEVYRTLAPPSNGDDKVHFSK
jgi:glycosyltransferase involved in cell wall biosynthesis